MQLLTEYESLLMSQLGALQVNKTLRSKESSKCIRDLAKLLADKSPELRRELVLQDKTLSINPVDSDV